jgi:ribose/xylose/arabinose/galactoside ABC-type transport system permease subunit
MAPPPPPAGDADRDRPAVHLIWEGVLAVIAVVLIVATAAMTPHQTLTNAFGEAGYLGLVAAGLAFSLRTGSPNLAVGSIVGFSSTLGAYLITAHHWGKPAAMVVAIVLSTLIGLVLGLLAAVLSMPAWIVTLGAVAVIQSIAFSITDAPVIPVRFGGTYPTALWYGLFFMVSAGGGALWLLPGVRGPLAASRGPGDPARWTGPRAGVGAIAGLTGSSFLAGLAAVPLLMRIQAAESSATNLTTVALAAVLLGGTSVFGRRAGVFGTLLAVTILAIVQSLVAYNDGPFWASTLVIGLAALFGVAACRGLESATDQLNRRRSASLAPPPALRPPPGW